MVDIFVCSCALDSIRFGLRDAVYWRWTGENGHLTILTPEIVGCTRQQFQGMRRPWIEANAKSDIYIMAEDDCMPWGPNFIERGLEVMAKYPEWAVLSPLLLPFPETPSMEENEDCYQGITCGGINFTRKGVMAKMDVPRHELFDEGGQAGWLKRAGWKYGWMKKVRQLHLGSGLSTIWPDGYQSGMTQVNEP